jgi:hypothetical protein
MTKEEATKKPAVIRDGRLLSAREKVPRPLRYATLTETVGSNSGV